MRCGRNCRNCLALNDHRFRGILLPQPQTVAQALLETALGVATVLEVLMHDYSSLPLFSLQPEIKEIPLTQGKVAIVDAADHEWLMQWKWCANFQHGLWYAVRAKRPKLIRMHRVILNAPDGIRVDHKDGDGLNNRRDNIRLCTPQQNSFNISPQSKSTSRFRGIHQVKSTGKWECCIKCNGKTRYLGHFDNEEVAAKVYDVAARELYGEFARLNFPDFHEGEALGYEIGAMPPFSKLTKEQVVEIRRLHSEGVMIKDLMLKFSVCRDTISKIVNFKKWKNV